MEDRYAAARETPKAATADVEAACGAMDRCGDNDSARRREAGHATDEQEWRGGAPAAGETILERPALLDRLRKSLEKRLILLNAPAGCGKSFAMTQLWRSLDASPGQRLHIRTSGEFDRLGDVLAKPGAPPLIFIDDYHLMETRERAQRLRRLLDDAPAPVRFIIATRRPPHCGVERLRLDGRLAEFGAADLAFSDAEAAQYLFEDAPPPAGLRRLARLSQGWPAALGLIRRSAADLREGVPNDGAAGAAARIAHYIEEEFTCLLPEALERFLLETACFTALDAGFLDEALERRDSRQKLVALETANCCLVAPAGRAGAWRRHPLLARYLAARSDATRDVKVAREVHLRAARRLVRDGEPVAALRHALATNSPEFSASILVETGAGLFECLAEPRLVAQLTETLQAAPGGAAARIAAWPAGLALAAGRPHEALQRLGSAPAASVDDRAERILIAALARLDLDASIADDMASLEGLGPGVAAQQPAHLALADYALGLARLRAGETESGESRLARASNSLFRAGLYGEAALARAHRALVALSAGPAGEAATAIAGARAAARRRSGAGGEACPDIDAVIDIVEGVLRYERGDFIHARALLADLGAALDAAPGQALEILASGACAQARMMYAVHGFAEALGFLDACSAKAGARRFERLQCAFDIEKCRLAGLHGDIALADGLVRRIGERIAHRRTDPAGIRDPLARQETEFAIARASLAIAKGAPENALALLRDLAPAAGRSRDSRLSHKAATLALLARRGLAGRNDLGPGIRALVSEGEALGLRSVFLEEGAQAFDLLREATRQYSRSRSAAWRAVQPIFESWLALAPSYMPPGRRPRKPDLTRQQKRVLSLLCQGFSRRAIAERTGTSIYNVQYHLRQLFAAFGVESSVSLIAEARRLGLTGDH